MTITAKRVQRGKLPDLSAMTDHYQLLIVAALSLAVALIGIGTPGIGFDEAATWWAAQLDWVQLGKLLANQDRNFAPYYTFMHLWMLPSDSLWWLRIPSAVGGALSVVATAGLCRHLFGTRAAWIAALLMVIAYSWVRFSQEVRPYSWSLAIATFATWAFVWMTGRRSRRIATVYLALMVVLPVTHLFAGIAAGVHLLYSLVAKDRKLAVLAIIGALPTLVAAGLVMGQVKQVSWLGAVTPLEAVRELVGLSKVVWYAPVAAAACAGLASYRRIRKNRGNMPAEFVLLVSWWACPPVFLWVVSELVTPVYAARYVFWTLPAMVLPAAALISMLFDLPKFRFIVAAALASLIALTIPGQVSARGPDGHLWAPQEFAALIIDDGEPGDGLVDADFLALTLQYHLRGHAIPEPLVLGAANAEGKFTDTQVPIASQLERLTDYSRLWVLEETTNAKPLPVGFCPEEVWTSGYGIARLTLATRCE